MTAEREFNRFLEQHLEKVIPLERASNLAYWNATISGKKRDFQLYADLQVQLQGIYSDKNDFEQVESWVAAGIHDNKMIRRQLQLLYNQYLRNQIDPQLNRTLAEMASAIEHEFNVYRATLDGKTVSENDILEILKESTDLKLRKKAWEAGKQVGSLVSRKLIDLVRLRNEAAQSLGFANYYTMSLFLEEQEEDEILALFSKLEELTRETFRKMKERVDITLAQRLGTTVEEIGPWHYEDPFFQKAPGIYNIDLDRFYEEKDILHLVRHYYESIGLEVGDILARSDLYEKPGKEQHAYCLDIDRNHDIRILANIKNDENWVGTMLHELGHAVYDKYIDPKLPYLLRKASHIFTTEAVAMLFGRLSKSADWIQSATGISDEEKAEIEKAADGSLRLSQLIFARWCQVMLHFERELYGDPEQDLNKLWWHLVEKYQLIKPPAHRDAPDWASKIHIVSVPVYYHNYMLGELLASQLHCYIQTHILISKDRRAREAGNPAVGEYLKNKVFKPGALNCWDAMILDATGEKLTPQYFIQEFVL